MVMLRAVVAAAMVVAASGLLSRRAQSEKDPMCINDHRAPQVFMIGVQKAGTSSLWHDLKNRFHLVGATPLADEPSFRAKEVSFFNNDGRFSKGRQFYLDHWPRCDSIKKWEKTLDASPNAILLSDLVAPRVKEFYGDSASLLKFIVIMRDPATRMESGYYHFYKDMYANFDEYVAKTIDQARKWVETGYDAPQPNLYQGSMYAKSLEPWMKLFSKDQFALITLRQYQQNPDKTMRFIGEKIGMEVRKVGNPDEVVHAHRRQHQSMSAKTRNLLDEFFAPFDKDLEALLKTEGMSPQEESHSSLWEGEMGDQ